MCKMNHKLWLFLFFTLLNIPSSLCQTYCENDNGNYTANSTYGANLNTLLSSPSTNIDVNGFYGGSAGEGEDRTNAISWCRGDVQLSTCRDCVQKAAALLLKSCPNQKQAVQWEEFCTVRYTNETLIGVPDTSVAWYWWNGPNVTSVDEFNKDLSGLVEHLKGQAASGGPLRKVAAGSVAGPDFMTIFALLQCTPDLSQEGCLSCLTISIANIPSCCYKKNGGRVLLPNCNLRFDIYPFYNKTRLQELDPTSVSVLAPPAPQPVPPPPPPPPLL